MVMHANRAVRGIVSSLLGALISTGCGGGYGGGSNSTAAMVSLSVSPTTIKLGQSATLTWSSTAGTTCTASGAWSGSQSASGTQAVTPTAAGTTTFTLSCTGGVYSSGKGSATLT